MLLCVGIYEDRLKADARGVTGRTAIVSADSLISDGKILGIRVPKVIRDNEFLFERLQGLHDTPKYWDDKGLNLEGERNLREIIADEDLDQQTIEEIIGIKL